MIVYNRFAKLPDALFLNSICGPEFGMGAVPAPITPQRGWRFALDNENK
jgi:hypothetical protein